MIIIGIICLVVGLILGFHILVTIGIILLIIGLVLLVLQAAGHGLGNRYWY